VGGSAGRAGAAIRWAVEGQLARDCPGWAAYRQEWTRIGCNPPAVLADLGRGGEAGRGCRLAVDFPGGPGADSLTGGAGNDDVRGLAGDRFDGGTGKDYVGGTGTNGLRPSELSAAGTDLWAAMFDTCFGYAIGFAEIESETVGGVPHTQVEDGHLDAAPGARSPPGWTRTGRDRTRSTWAR
jgi:hypothetical protein